MLMPDAIQGEKWLPQSLQIVSNSLIQLLHELFGHLNVCVFLSTGGFLEKSQMARFSYFSLSFSVKSGSRSNLTNALEHSLKHQLKQQLNANIEYTSFVPNSFSYSISRMAVFIALLYSLKKLSEAIYLLLIELSLAKQKEMNCFGSLPRISQSFVCRCCYITRNKRIHCFCSYFSSSLTCSCY